MFHFRKNLLNTLHLEHCGGVLPDNSCGNFLKSLHYTLFSLYLSTRFRQSFAERLISIRSRAKLIVFISEETVAFVFKLSEQEQSNLIIHKLNTKYTWKTGIHHYHREFFPWNFYWYQIHSKLRPQFSVGWTFFWLSTHKRILIIFLNYDL